MKKDALEIIHETNDFIAVNKPAGLLSIPDREGKEISLKQILQQKYAPVFTVHRLDKETSGIILFAKNESAHKALSQIFETREAEKYYYALVHGKLSQQHGTIDMPIMQNARKAGTMQVHAKGKASLTTYEVIENFSLYTWLKLRIFTGRTHQIRVHLQQIGHPVVCDNLYGDGAPVYVSQLRRNYHLSKKEEEEKPILSRLALHSSILNFQLEKTFYRLEAPLPKDLKALLQQLKKAG